MSLFPDFWHNFFFFFLADAPPINQNKKSVKGHFFYHSSCKNSVWTHIFNYTDALPLHTMTLGRPLFWLHLLKPFWIKDCRTLSPKAMHRVCYFRWCQHVLSWTVVVWLDLVSCILPPFCQFCAAICHWQLLIKTHHIWRWLTSIKL